MATSKAGRPHPENDDRDDRDDVGRGARYDVAEIARRTRIDVRRLRYLLDRGGLPPRTYQGGGRGSRRRFLPAVATALALGGAMLEAGVSVTQVGRYLGGYLATAHKYGAKMDAASRVEPGTSLYIDFADQMNTRLRRVAGDGRETVEPWHQLRTGARLGSDYRPLAVASVNVGELTRRLFAD